MIFYTVFEIFRRFLFQFLIGYNRRDDQGSSGSGTDRQDGSYSSGNYSRGGGYRNNRGGFNNDYYNRRQEPRV